MDDEEPEWMIFVKQIIELVSYLVIACVIILFIFLVLALLLMI